MSSIYPVMKANLNDSVTRVVLGDFEILESGHLVCFDFDNFDNGWEKG